MAALLDEACAQVAGVVVSPSVTARLDVRYLAPVPVGEPIRIEAQVTETAERRATAEASMRDASGLVLAHARADCTYVRPEHFLSTPQGRTRGLDWLPADQRIP